jgi:hypothetical protein
MNLDAQTTNWLELFEKNAEVAGGRGREWEQSRFFQLWQEEKQAGRDPNQAFQDRGWES